MRLLTPTLRAPCCSILLLFLLPGCTTKDFRTEGDEMRARIMEMQRTIDRLERRNRELEAEVRRAARADGLDDGVASQIPHVVELVVARFSHLRDTSGDGIPDEARLYLHTLDARGRFIQAVGELSVRAMILPRDGAADPVTVGSVLLGPAELHDVYRSSMMGTHYTVALPIAMSADEAAVSAPDMDAVLVRVTFSDGTTGLQHHADQTLRVRR